ncbi:esterase-like activity of phytase family protein [Celerinatantimonas sp. YJH-8]|uniref:esterase-like activity of phytase family protein n=1 Tax=Celerinatantimonas sp. YJH-8 TaxID=3228714 RepID=UPI0038C30C24
MQKQILSVVLLAMFGHSSHAVELSVQSLNIPLDTITTPHPLNLSVGIGSGAYHRPSDPNDIIYTISDRGPNIKCKDSEKLIGHSLCKSGKIFPEPYFTPSIYTIQVSKNGVSVIQRTKIKTVHHLPISGISTPDTEPAFDINGHRLPDDPNGVDSESLVRTTAGDFYISDEYGPSILHLAADGTILQRWIPKGTSARFKGADYPIKEVLPAILAKRHLNRGIESIALSPDEMFIYFAMQSPLDNPDSSAYKKSRLVRLFKVNREQEIPVGEYLYQMDRPDTFKKDSQIEKPKQSDVKVSDMTAVGADKLILLERITKTTKFYEVTLSDANKVAPKWDSRKTQPTLEQSTDLPVLSKSLVLSTDNIPNAPDKLEGIAYVSPKLWYLVNDNDFGIDGQTTQIVTVHF